MIPIKGIIPGNPSRKSINMNEVNTNAEPVSFCIMMISIGSSIIPDTMAYDLNPSSLKVCRLIIFANINEVINLANSAGCRLNGPMGSRDRDPLMSRAIHPVSMRSSKIQT